MGDKTDNYRVHLTIRRQGDSIFTSHEFKSEEQNDLLDLMACATEFVIVRIAEDEEERES